MQHSYGMYFLYDRGYGMSRDLLKPWCVELFPIQSFISSKKEN